MAVELFPVSSDIIFYENQECFMYVQSKVVVNYSILYFMIIQLDFVYDYDE